MDVHRPSQTNAFFSPYCLLFMTTVKVKEYDKAKPWVTGYAMASLWLLYWLAPFRIVFRIRIYIGSAFVEILSHYFIFLLILRR